MRKLLAICISMSCAALPAQADVVQLTHGGEITGTVLNQHRAGIDLETAAGHVFNIPWSNIAGITEGSAVPEFYIDETTAIPVPSASPRQAQRPLRLTRNAVRSNARFQYAPRLTTSRRTSIAGWGGVGGESANSYNSRPVANAVRQEAANTNADITTNTDKASNTGLWDAVWNGRANFGASLQTGNTENSAISADATLKAKWGDKHRASVKLEYNREEDDGDVTEDNRKLSAAYDHFFNDRWFFNSQGSLEQDDIDNIDLRSTLGLGLGHQLFESEELNLQYILGGTYLRTEFENDNTEDSLAARWALDYDQYYWDKTFQGFHEHEILVPTDDSEAFLFDSKTGLRMPIRNGIVGTAEVDFEWDNDPAPGIKEDDTTYSLKLGYEW